MNPARFGIVGLGWIGSRYLVASRGMADLVVAGVVDELSERLPADGSVEAFGSYQEMAEQVPLDAVVVCTPPVTHPDVAGYFLDRGVAVLCEKPFAVSAAAAERMCDHARAQSVPIAMATKYRCLEEVRSARSLISEGTIGDIVSFEIAFTNNRDMRASWHSDRQISGGGVFTDAGAHAIDVITYLLSPPSELLAVAGMPVQHLAVEDSAHALIRLSDGTIGAALLSWNGDWGHDYYAVVEGTTGVIRLGWQSSEYRTVATNGWQQIGRPYSIERPLAYQLLNFGSALRGETPFIASAPEALANVMAICAGNDSLASGCWENVMAVVPKPEIAAIAAS